MAQGKGSQALVSIPPEVTRNLARHQGFRLAGAIVALMATAADQIGRMERGLPKGEPFVLVVIGVAPGTDTPSSVRTFATSHGWIAEWHWFMGTRAQLAPVWNAYTVDAEPNPTAANHSNVAHSGVLYLIDPQGYDRVGFGLNFPPEVVQYDIGALSPHQGWRWPWN